MIQLGANNNRSFWYMADTDYFSAKSFDCKWIGSYPHCVRHRAVPDDVGRHVASFSRITVCKTPSGTARCREGLDQSQRITYYDY